MDQEIATGFDDGMRVCMSQIDALLADDLAAHFNEVN